MRVGHPLNSILLLVLLAVAVRLPWVFLHPTHPDLIKAQLPDQYEYLVLGHNLRHEGWLWFHDARFNEDVHAFRMPGYPAFVALLGPAPTRVRIAQILLDASTAIGVYLLARRFLISPPRRRDSWGTVVGPGSSWSELGPARRRGKAGEAAAGGGDASSTSVGAAGWLRNYLPLIAGLLVVFNPWLAYFSTLLLSETLFTAMLLWGMVLLVPRERNGRAWFFGIVLLAMSSYVRPSAIPLAAVLAAAAAFVNRQAAGPYQVGRQNVVWRATAAGLFGGLVTLLVLLPWGARNASHPRIESWLWTTTNAGITAYDALRPGATGVSDQSFIANMPQLRTMTELERSRHLGALARQELFDDPGRIARLAVTKIGRTWSPIPLGADSRRLRYILPALLFTGPFFVLVILGIASPSRDRADPGQGPDNKTDGGRSPVNSRLTRSVKLYLLLPAVYLTAVHALSVGSARYRIPAEPPMAVLAAAALGSFVPRPTRPAAS